MYLATQVDLKQGSNFHELQPNNFDTVIHFAAVANHHSCDQNLVGALQSNFMDHANSEKK